MRERGFPLFEKTPSGVQVSPLSGISARLKVPPSGVLA